MSAAETRPYTPDVVRAPSYDTGRRGQLRGVGRFVRSELGMVFRRRRNVVLLVILGLVPVLISLAVKLGGEPQHAGSIFNSITDNGIFAALAALLVLSPLFLPLVASVVAGDSI